MFKRGPYASARALGDVSLLEGGDVSWPAGVDVSRGAIGDGRGGERLNVVEMTVSEFTAARVWCATWCVSWCVAGGVSWCATRFPSSPVSSEAPGDRSEFPTAPRACVRGERHARGTVENSQAVVFAGVRRVAARGPRWLVGGCLLKRRSHFAYSGQVSAGSSCAVSRPAGANVSPWTCGDFFLKTERTCSGLGCMAGRAGGGRSYRRSLADCRGDFSRS